MPFRHNPLRLFLTLLAGFSLAFIFLFALTVSVPLVGDILIGQVPLSREHPTVASAAMMTWQMQEATQALASFWFWTGVTAIGIFFTAELWKWARG